MAKAKKARTWVPVFLLVFVPFLAIALSSLVLYRGVLSYLATSQYFNVRALKVDGIADSRYIDLMKKEILGVNIFRIDMARLSDRIKQRFPTFYSVTVSRVLPSQLSIVAKERLPVAIIKKGASYVLDDEGVALS
jgi:cell division septal protein FtsQ